MEKQIKMKKEKRKRKKTEEIENYSSTEKMENKDVEENLLSNKKRRSLENFLYSSCRTGDVSNLIEFVNFFESKDYTSVPDAIPRDAIDAILESKENWDWKSMKFGANEKTLLHIASENGHKELIWWLLEKGCDPCLKNKRNETPFVATKVKEAKNHFRRFMAAYPEKYDYTKANIPGPLTKEQELEQKAKQVIKKKQQKKAKEEKLKEEKREQEKLQKEKEEKENFLKLSDREKRAIAAERRILAKQQNLSVPRCFQCAADLSSITPFEYCDFKFCSTKCVKEHRSKNKQS
ncbi:Ankyrin repeat and zinc finger domain-containing protein 1 [Armadillidium vulgare]|nr:Ankyrin repeat and zinc finger domain-containing protein 1 [Armadillidium vulgare]